TELALFPGLCLVLEGGGADAVGAAGRPVRALGIARPIITKLVAGLARTSRAGLAIRAGNVLVARRARRVVAGGIAGTLRREKRGKALIAIAAVSAHVA